MTDKSSKALWEGHVLCPQGRQDTDTAEAGLWGLGARLCALRTLAAARSTHRSLQAQADWELAHRTPRSPMSVCSMTHSKMPPLLTSTERPRGTPGWMADWISMNTRVKHSAIPQCRVESSVQFSRSVVSNSATLWTVACQASLSITNSRSLLNLMSIESVMPSNHLILCRPLLLLPSIFPSIRVFSNESVLHIRLPKYWEFQLQHQSFQ